MILKVLLTSLDRLSYLTNRLYASTVLDNRISEIGRMLKIYKALPMELENIEKVDVRGKNIEFKQNIKINEVDEFVEIFEIDLSVNWQEGNRDVSASRSAYISDFEFLSK